MRTPASGLSGAYFSRMDMSPGISFSAMVISLRPHSARERSRTLKSEEGKFWVNIIFVAGC